MPHEHILVLIDLLAAHNGKSPHTVGRWASGDGALYARLRRGRSITTHRAARVIQWLHANWPADLQWPANVPHPEPNGQDNAA